MKYLVGLVQLPNGASLDRTESVVREMGEIALKEPGVRDAVQFPGLPIAGFTNSPNAGVVSRLYGSSATNVTPTTWVPSISVTCVR